MKILFLGAGNMAYAVCVGAKDFWKKHDVYIYSPSGIGNEKIRRELPTIKDIISNDLVKDTVFDMVFLAFKPLQIKNVSHSWKEQISNSKLIVSFCAGVELSNHFKILQHQRVIRLIPNSSCLHGHGILLGYKKLILDKREEELFINLSTLLGEILWMDSDEKLDESVILASSGPALLYKFLIYLQNFGDKLDESEKEQILKSMLRGATTQWIDSSIQLNDLISVVATKGGITQSILQSWDDNGMRDIIVRGANEGLKKSRLLNQQILTL